MKNVEIESMVPTENPTMMVNSPGSGSINVESAAPAQSSGGTSQPSKSKCEIVSPQGAADQQY